MKPIFTRKETQLLKGLAVVLMFIHHFFTLPGWLIDGIAYNRIAQVADIFIEPFKLCVPVFAFLTGYLYYFSSDKSLGRSLRKIGSIYLGYWLIFLPFYLFSLASGAQPFTVSGFLLELLALKNYAIVLNWYVFFFAVFMLILPFADKYLYRTGGGIALFGVFLPILLSSYDLCVNPNPYMGGACAYIRQFYPTVSVGYLFAKYGYLDRAWENLSEKMHRIPAMLLCAALTVICCMGRFWWPSVDLGVLNFHNAAITIPFQINLDLLYAPGFCLAVMALRRFAGDGKIAGLFTAPFEAFGRRSLEMWLFSSIFFGINKLTFQPMLYWPHNPLLVLIWGLLICYLAALLFSLLQKLILQGLSHISAASRRS